MAQLLLLCLLSLECVCLLIVVLLQAAMLRCTVQLMLQFSQAGFDSQVALVQLLLVVMLAGSQMMLF